MMIEQSRREGEEVFIFSILIGGFFWFLVPILVIPNSLFLIVAIPLGCVCYMRLSQV